MRLHPLWLGLLVVCGLLTGAGLGAWVYGVDGLVRLPDVLSTAGDGSFAALRQLVARLPDNLLLALACVAAMALLLLRDAALDWGDRRRLARIREVVGLGGPPARH